MYSFVTLKCRDIGPVAPAGRLGDQQDLHVGDWESYEDATVLFMTACVSHLFSL
jgi:hypothetical protein